VSRRDQVFAAITPWNALTYAERHPNLLAAVKGCAGEYGCGIADLDWDEVTWYQLPAGTKIDHWKSEFSTDQADEWEAADPTRIPADVVRDIVSEVAS
jgi:hypothetical protein